MSTTDQLILGTITQCFRKYIYNECIIGQLAHSEFKDGVNKGDEVDVLMPVTVNLFDYDGGELPDAEETDVAAAKVRIDKGKAFHFVVNEVKKKLIENAPTNEQKVELAKEYSMDAVKQFAAAVDTAYGTLYTRAGHYLDNSGAAITLTPAYAKEIFSYMQAEFKRGDGKGHTNWIDGQMVAIVPPEYQFYLQNMTELQYVESGHKAMQKGYIGKEAGWEILVSNNIAQDTDGNFYPLFGQKGKTLAGGISSNLNTKSYEPDKTFDTCYKGYGLFGVGAPRADLFGAVKVDSQLSLAALHS